MQNWNKLKDCKQCWWCSKPPCCRTPPCGRLWTWWRWCLCSRGPARRTSRCKDFSSLAPTSPDHSPHVCKCCLRRRREAIRMKPRNWTHNGEWLTEKARQWLRTFKSWISTPEKSCTSCPNWGRGGWWFNSRNARKEIYFLQEVTPEWGTLVVWGITKTGHFGYFY